MAMLVLNNTFRWKPRNETNLHCRDPQIKVKEQLVEVGAEDLQRMRSVPILLHTETP
jgi:hypothetical protein